MAGNLLEKNYGTGICKFYIDSENEIEFLPTLTKDASGNFLNNPEFNLRPEIGSTCIVGNYGGDMIVYILTSSGWSKI